MKIINNLIVAFSLYSRIPMPKVEWSDENTKHALAFLPWIGTAIGLICTGIYFLTERTQLPLVAMVCIYSLVPLLVTGGFHIDGYMDVQDALKSYKSKEEKLEILKDPHIGAFSIIRFAVFALVWIGAMSIICDSGNEKILMLSFLIFILSRSIAVILSLKLKHARTDGMLNMETERSTNVDVIYSAVQALFVICICAYLYPVAAAVFILVAAAVVLNYKKTAYLNFGGVTGDTTGYFISEIELWLLISVAVLSHML